MITAKGSYKWKLIDSKTGEVKEEGFQNNLITDRGHQSLIGMRSRVFATGGDSEEAKIFISETTPTPVTDFPRLKSGLGGIVVTEDGSATIESNGKNFWEGSRLFGAPVGVRTITIIGLHSQSNLLSFIELSTPVVQTTSDQFFVEYRMESALTGYGDNGYVNNYISTYLDGVIAGSSNDPSAGVSTGFFPTLQAQLTAFLPPSDPSLIGRPSSYNVYTKNIDDSQFTRNYDRFSGLFTDEILEGGYSGAYGVQLYSSDISARTAFAYSNFTPVPNVSDIFKKPPGDWGKYNDATPPFPTSKGSASLSGTPTEDLVNKHVSLYISKGGDASDIAPENFTTDFVTNNELTVAQDWDNTVLGNQVTCELSTTGTLPAPLAIDTEYWVIYVDATHIKLSATEGGGEITLTDDGSGVHTITRTSTAEIKLRESLDSEYSIGHTWPLEVDASVLPSSGSSVWGAGPVIVSGSVYIENGNGNFLYMALAINSSWRLVRWNFMTIESSVKVFDMPGRPLEMLNRGSIIYFVDSTGLHIYDTDTETLTDSFTDSTPEALLETSCKDMAIDEVNDIIWIGHSLGLTEFNPVSKTVVSTHDISGTFSSLNAGKIAVHTGQLTAHAGFVCKGSYYDDETVAPYNTSQNEHAWIWVYDHLGSGKVAEINPSGGSFPFNTLRSVGLKGDNEGSIIVDCGRPNQTSSISDIIVLKEFSFDFVPPTPTFNEEFSINSGISGFNYSGFGSDGILESSKVYRVGVNQFTIMYREGDPGRVFYAFLDLDEAFVRAVTFGGGTSVTAANSDAEENRSTFSCVFARGAAFGIYSYAMTKIFSEYGWSGSSWDIAESSGRPMEDSAMLIKDGLSVDFENAGGQPSAEQFIQYESFSYSIGPLQTKTNLQKLRHAGAVYLCDSTNVVDLPIVVPGAPHEFYVPEAPLGSAPVADFRFVEPSAYLIKVFHSTEGEYTQVGSSPVAGEYSIDSETGKFTFAAADDGKSLEISYTYGERH